MKKPPALGHGTRVELCRGQDSLLSIVDPVALGLDSSAAKDVVTTLGQTLLLLTPSVAGTNDRSESPPIPDESTTREPLPFGAPDPRQRERTRVPDEWDVPTVPELFGPSSN